MYIIICFVFKIVKQNIILYNYYRGSILVLNYYGCQLFTCMKLFIYQVTEIIVKFRVLLEFLKKEIKLIYRNHVLCHLLPFYYGSCHRCQDDNVFIHIITPMKNNVIFKWPTNTQYFIKINYLLNHINYIYFGCTGAFIKWRQANKAVWVK